MRKALIVAFWAFTTAAILYLLLDPQTGALYAGPGAVMALGLVGLGLIRRAQEEQGASAAASVRGS